MIKETHPFIGIKETLWINTLLYIFITYRYCIDIKNNHITNIIKRNTI